MGCCSVECCNYSCCVHAYEDGPAVNYANKAAGSTNENSNVEYMCGRYGGYKLFKPLNFKNMKELGLIQEINPLDLIDHTESQGLIYDLYDKIRAAKFAFEVINIILESEIKGAHGEETNFETSKTVEELAKKIKLFSDYNISWLNNILNENNTK